MGAAKSRLHSLTSTQGKAGQIDHHEKNCRSNSFIPTPLLEAFTLEESENNNAQDDEHSNDNSLKSNSMLDINELGKEDDENSLNSMLDMIENSDSNNGLSDDETDDVDDAQATNATGYKLVNFAKLAETMSAKTVCK